MNVTTPTTNRLQSPIDSKTTPALSRMFVSVRTYPMIFIGGTIVLLLVLVALFAPVIAPYDPSRQFSNGLTAMGTPVGPSHQFLWGTDPDGRDVFSRVVYGSRVSLEVGVFATLISLVIGVVLGLVSGYFGRWVDTLIMRLTDTMLAFPFILFVIALVAILKPSTFNVFVAIGVLGWANMARIVRAQVLVVKNLEYVHAARSIGASMWSIVFVEILPNVIPPVMVIATLTIGGNILAESALSFLGLGVQPPNPSWGNMLEEGMTVYQIAPWMIYGPGMSLLLAVLGFNLLGDGLRDRLDPKIGK